MRFGFLLLIIVWATMPSLSYAAVIINEIAWMGSADSANDEWIELHNTDGSGVSLEGWTVTDSVNLNITLEGTITGNAFAVLERTDDSSAPGNAFMIYTGALSNTGATLKLIRADGSIEDQVAGGENWGTVGGNNETKSTAQFTEGGWITAKGTPGSANATKDDQSNEPDDGESPSSGSTRFVSAGKAKQIKLSLPDVELSLAVDAPTIAYVNEPLEFGVIPSGIGKTFMDSLRYEWNFGDGSVGFGKNPHHVYAYPGEYVVVAHAAFSRHEQMQTHMVTVLPTSFSLTRLSSGDVQVHNDAPYEIEVSGYEVSAERSFIFPQRSVLLAKSTVTLPYARIGMGHVTLRDQAGLAVSSTYESSRIEGETFSHVTEASQGLPRTAVTTSGTDFLFPSDTSQESSGQSDGVLSGEGPVNGGDMSAAVSEVRRPLVPTNSVPYLALVGVVTLGTIGLLVRKGIPDRISGDDLKGGSDSVF